MVTPRDDQLVEKLWPDFVGRNEGIPIWKQLELGSFFDPDDLSLVLRFGDHMLNPLGSGLYGNYFIGSRGEWCLNHPTNATFGYRGSVTLVPSLWTDLPAQMVLPQTTNECNNPSFDHNITNWSSASLGTIARSVVRALSGHSSLLCTSGGGSFYAQACYTGSTTAFLGTDDYAWSIWYYNWTLPVGGDVRMFVYWTGGANPPAVSPTQVVGTVKGNGWHYARAIFTPDYADRTFGQFYIQLMGTANGQAAFVDCAQVEQGQDFCTPYADGNRGEGYRWAGTPGNSVSYRTANVLNLTNEVDVLSQNDTLTCSYWIQAWYDSTENGPGTIWYVQDVRGGAGNDLRIIYSQTNQYFYLYLNGTSLVPSTTFTFSRGDWIHLGVTFDFINDEYKLYVNGRLIETWTNPFASTTLTSWYVGSDSAYGFSGCWAYGEIAVLDRILTATEMLNIYSKRQPIVDLEAADITQDVGISIYRNGSQTITTATWTTVQFNAVNYNEGMIFDSTNYRVYVTQSGWYTVEFSYRFAASSAGFRRGAELQLNGVAFGYDTRYPCGPSMPTMGQVVRKLYLSVGDYLSVRVDQDTGGNLSLDYTNYSPQLTVLKIRNFQKGPR